MLRSSASPATSSTQRRVDSSVANSHESRMNSAGLLLIHRSAWNRNSQKFISKILHSPAPIPLEPPLQAPRSDPPR
jgi:hypothetical protein